MYNHRPGNSELPPTSRASENVKISPSIAARRPASTRRPSIHSIASSPPSSTRYRRAVLSSAASAAPGSPPQTPAFRRQTVIRRFCTSISFALRGGIRDPLSRTTALEHQTIKVAHLADRIVAVCLMHKTAVVPDHHIPRFPLMAILELQLRRVLEQFVEQRQRLGVVHSDDFFDPYRIDIDRLAAGPRMGSHERVDDGFRCNAFTVRRQLRQLPLAMLALINVTRLQPIDSLLHVLGQGIIGLIHVHELGVATCFRELDGMQRGRLWRLTVVGVIRVVALTRDVNLPVFQLVLIGDVVDLGAFWHRKARIVLWK